MNYIFIQGSMEHCKTSDEGVTPKISNEFVSNFMEPTDHVTINKGVISPTKGVIYHHFLSPLHIAREI